MHQIQASQSLVSQTYADPVAAAKAAQAYWKKRDDKAIVILVSNNKGEGVFFSWPSGGIMQQSEFVNQNKEFWAGLNVTAFVYKANEDLICLAVYTPHGIERLNKQDCLGRSLNYLDPEVFEPRIKAIKEALETGKTVLCHRTHNWAPEGEPPLHWEFTDEVTPLPELGEVLVRVHDKHPWQVQWWLNRAGEARSHSA